MLTTAVDTKSNQNPCKFLQSPCWKNVTHAVRRLLTALAVTLTLSVSSALCQVPAQPGTEASNAQQSAPKSDAVKKSAMQKVVPDTKSGRTSTQDSKAARPPSLTSMGLDDMLATALKDNPDIRVAESKLHQAETELNRIRLEVAQKVMSFHHDWAVQKAKLDEYDERARTAERLKGSGASTEEWRLAQVNVEINRLHLTKLEDELPYLLGKTPPGVPSIGNQTTTRIYVLANAVATEQLKNVLAQSLGELDSRSTVEMLSPTNSFVISGSPQTHAAAAAIIRSFDRPGRQLSSKSLARSEMTEKLCKLLDGQATLDFLETPLDDVIQFLRDYTQVNFHLSKQLVSEGKALTVTVAVKDVPLGACLQAIEDSLNSDVRFVAREYGILVTRDQPSDGWRLLELWREGKQHGDTKPNLKQ